MKYGGCWYAQAKKWSWILRTPPGPFWRVISHYDLELGIWTLRRAHTDFARVYAHDTSEEAAETISRFIDNLDEEREKERPRIERVLPVEIVRSND